MKPTTTRYKVLLVAVCLVVGCSTSHNNIADAFVDHPDDAGMVCLAPEDAGLSCPVGWTKWACSVPSASFTDEICIRPGGTAEDVQRFCLSACSRRMATTGPACSPPATALQNCP